MTLSASMNVAQQALTIHQNVLSVVSNNIANVNTEGYSKQRAELSSIKGTGVIGNAIGRSYHIGAGVQISKISSYRDSAIDNTFRNENSDLSYYETLYNNASSIEETLNELGDTGLKNAFANFFDAVQTLTNDPSSSVYRNNFVQAAKNVSSKFNDIAKSLVTNRDLLVGDPLDATGIEYSIVNSTVIDINSKIKQISKINHDILMAEADGNSASELRDERARLLDELSSSIPINVTENSNGTINISLDGIRLLRGTEIKAELSYKAGDENTPAIINIVDSADNVLINNINNRITSGSLGAVLEMGSSETGKLSYKNILNEVDKLANSFAQMVNDIQTYQNGDVKAMAIDIDAATGELSLKESSEKIFVTSDGSNTINATNISINDIVFNNPYEVACARITVDGTENLQSIGNSDNLKELINSRNQNITALGNTNIESFLTSLTGDIGVKTLEIENNLSTQQTATQYVETERQNKIGVNLDEELMELIKFQRAYEAAARIFNTSSELMLTMVNLGT